MAALKGGKRRESVKRQPRVLQKKPRTRGAINHTTQTHTQLGRRAGVGVAVLGKHVAHWMDGGWRDSPPGCFFDVCRKGALRAGAREGRGGRGLPVCVKRAGPCPGKKQRAESGNDATTISLSSPHASGPAAAPRPAPPAPPPRSPGQGSVCERLGRVACGGFTKFLKERKRATAPGPF